MSLSLLSFAGSGKAKKEKTKTSGGPTRAQIQSVIDTTITTVTIVKEITAFEPAKGALGALCSMLELLQTCLDNGDDLTEIAQRCQRVAVVVKRAAESDRLKTDEHLMTAIGELQRFVDAVCQDIRQRQGRSALRKLFNAHGDAKQIEGLKETLRDFLQDFQVHLELTQRMDVIEILELVKVQPAQSAETGSRSVKYHTPPKPTIFFGREDVVTDIVESIQRGQHVMLVGTGGMGKSSIAKTVLNDSTLVSTFKARLFITYDGISSSAMTYQLFLDRIADALRLPSSTYHFVLEHLESLSALLVIDNAETLLEASDVDAGRIAETLGVIADLKAIRVIVTTRNHARVSANFQCKRLAIGGISLDAACQAFSAVYTLAPVNEDMRSIFTALDYHPLSINILANAAAMNDWSPNEIVKVWNERQAGVLETANDKYRSLRVTIEISIASFKDNSSVVLQLLRTIAFLPQGIHRDDIRAMFPSISNISLQVEAVQRSSLIYKIGERLTMLAPIRMYLSERYNKDLAYQDPVVSGIRAYFHDELCNTAQDFVDREHGNIDRLLHFDMTSADYTSNLDINLLVLKNVAFFLVCAHKPTSLWPLLESQMQTLTKAPAIELLSKCLPFMCWVDYKCSEYNNALAKVQISEVYCRRHSILSRKSLVECLQLKAAVFESLGNIRAAVVTAREGLSIAENLNIPHISHSFVVMMRVLLADLLLMSGEITEPRALLSSVQGSGWPEVLTSQAKVAILEKRFNHARTLLKAAVKQEAGLDRRHHDAFLIQDILRQASCEGYAGDFAVALKLLQKATEAKVESGTRQFFHYVEAIEARSYYEARLGYLVDARRSIIHALELWSERGEWSWSGNFVRACVEWFGGEQQRAMSLLRTILDRQMTPQLREMHQYCLADTHKTLGELMLADMRHADAKAQFQQAKVIYDAIGCSPKHREVRSAHWHSLCVENEGWDRFLEEN